MRLYPDSDSKSFDSQYDESVSSSRDTDLKETWSDSARKAAAESRRRGVGGKHQVSGAEFARAQMTKDKEPIEKSHPLLKKMRDVLGSASMGDFKEGSMSLRIAAQHSAKDSNVSTRDLIKAFKTHYPSEHQSYSKSARSPRVEGAWITNGKNSYWINRGLEHMIPKEGTWRIAKKSGRGLKVNL